MDARFCLGVVLSMVVGCSATTSGDGKLSPDGGTPDAATDATPPRRDGSMPGRDAMPPRPDSSHPSMPGSPGSACNCDDECHATGGNQAVCVRGICMALASEACSAAGSQDECPTGSRCWGLGSEGVYVCWPDCDANDCAGECDSDGSCVPTEENTCDAMCCGEGLTPPVFECSAEHTDGVCAADDQVCIRGECVDRCTATNPDGYCPTGSECQMGVCTSTSGCPTWVCEGADCDDIIAMPGSYDATSPEAQAAGYYIATEEPYAFLRKDLTMLIQYAACEVAARFPGTNPIGLSDLSQSDGLTPGSDEGDPRHPTSTHTGNDMDLAYYQTDGTNNPQIICGDGSDRNGNGRMGMYNDGYFCTTEDNIIDWEREAYWFAKLASTPLVRVFGIDQTLVDDFQMHLEALHTAGEISDDEYERALSLGYGADGGWQFHHHHSHMSYSRP